MGKEKIIFRQLYKDKYARKENARYKTDSFDKGSKSGKVKSETETRNPWGRGAVASASPTTSPPSSSPLHSTLACYALLSSFSF
jgi:hypothetical protein